jgi:hypothetical protein
LEPVVAESDGSGSDEEGLEEEEEEVMTLADAHKLGVLL